MPLKSIIIPKKTMQYFENVSFECQVEAWCLRDGWQVLQPRVDHGSKTDVFITDGNHNYRIQVKSIDTLDESIKVAPMWCETDNIDYVIYFSKKAPWGFITPQFSKKRKLNHPEHIRFHQDHKNFKRSFDKA